MTTDQDMTPEQLAKMMARVQKLLTEADNMEQFISASGEVNDAERKRAAANFREKAESLMRKYRIAEESLIATDASVITPITRDVVLCHKYNHFDSEYQMLMYWIADHAGIRLLTKRVGSDFVAELWGYEADIRLAEMLWSSTRLVFGQYLEPKVDSGLTDQINAYNLRRSGMLRKDVATAMWGLNTPANRSRAQRLYVKECLARDERPALEGLGTDTKTYREAYASGFISTFHDRLRASRDAADSHGGSLVFAGRAERINEAMYVAHPYLRPKPVSEEKTIEEKTPTKPWKPTKADLRRWARQNNDSARAGRAAGGEAAYNVDIQPTTNPAQRLVV